MLGGYHASVMTESDTPVDPPEAGGPEDSAAALPVLKGQPLPYHLAVRDYLQTADPSVWNWFVEKSVATDNAAADPAAASSPQHAAAESTRVTLLKTAVRLDRETERELYACGERLRDRMGIAAPLTFYQAQNVSEPSAFLVWIPGELHVMFGGPLRDGLSAAELSAVICHEFAHFELSTLDDGDFLQSERLLQALAVDHAAASPHERTLRSFRLWTELYCDRRAAEVLDNVDDVISTLIKVETGLKDVNPRAYVQQAREIIADGRLTSAGVTHPEVYLRAFALDGWAEDPGSVDERLQPLVEGRLQLDTLDLLQQQQLVRFTQTFVRRFLNAAWLQTRLMVHHAQRFLDPDAALGQAVPLEVHEVSDAKWDQMQQTIATFDEELRRYLCYVLLDFIRCDADLEEGPLAAGFLMCERVGLLAEYRDLVQRELKPGKRALQSVEAGAEKLVQDMADGVTA